MQETCKFLQAEICQIDNRNYFLRAKAKTRWKTFGHKFHIILQKQDSGTVIELYYNFVGMRGGPYKAFAEKFFNVFSKQIVLESKIQYDVLELKVANSAKKLVQENISHKLCIKYGSTLKSISLVLILSLTIGMMLPLSYSESSVKMTVQTDKQVYEYVVDPYGNNGKIIISGWIDPTTKPPKDAVQQISLYIFDENNNNVCPDWCDRTSANIYTGQYNFEILLGGDYMQPGKHYTIKTAYYNYSATTPAIYIDDIKYKQMVQRQQDKIDVANKQQQEQINTRNGHLQEMVNNTMANPVCRKSNSSDNVFTYCMRFMAGIRA